MPSLTERSAATPHDVDLVDAFVTAVVAATDVQPIDEARWAARRGDGRAALVIATEDDTTVGVAVVSSVGAETTVDLAVHPDAPTGVDVDLLARAVDDDARPGSIEVWTQNPSAALDAAAGTRGLIAERELLELRRPLPIEPTTSLTTRAFRPGADDEEWLAVNGAAFADHPDQGAWTSADLAARLAEDWFDPEGFRILDVDGRMAAFCWTKVHAERDLGEIYVIAVHPEATGRGLGRAMTEDGLRHLADHVPAAMLYVEANNTPAVALYRSLGFTTHHRVRSYVGSRP